LLTMPWDDAGRRPATRSGVVAVVAVVAASALVLLLAVWSASTGPGDPLRGNGPTPDRVSVSEPETTAPVAESTPGENDSEPASSTLNTVMLVVLAVIALAMLSSLLWLVLAIRPRLRRSPPRDRSEEVAPLETTDAEVVDAVVSALTDDADAQLRALEEGSPRNGIVACWHHFELRAAAVGVAREPWETSAEFTMRLLDLVSPDGSAVARLAVRYREARFSDHPITEADRADAREALTAIQAGLRTGARRVESDRSA
jgi:hypothetical protein